MSRRREGDSADPKASRIARGLRLEGMRKSLRLSRRTFAGKVGLSEHTLQNWEDNKSGGLTEKSAVRVIQALKLAGIVCTYEWLMYGIEPAPTFSDPLLGIITTLDPAKSSHQLFESEDELSCIAKELRAFRENYPQLAIDMVVNDDGMEPKFVQGEYIAGLKRFGGDLATVVGLDCITQTEDGDILLRQVKKTNVDGHYTLICTNPHTTVIKTVMYDVKLLMAAPIIWTRRKQL